MKNRKRLVSILAGIMAAIMLLTLILGLIPTQVRAASSSEIKKQIEELQNISEVLRSRQAKLKKDISLIDQILEDGQMTEAHLRLLIEKILVYETEGGLRLEIKVKAPFQNHTDTYENGELTNSELEEIIKAG